MAIKVEQSRFALLKIDDDYDSDEKQGGKPGAANKSGKQTTAASQAAKKKKQNKKKAAITNTEEGNKGGKKTSGVHEVKDLDDWNKIDEKLVASAYEKDLHEALVTSKLQYEEQKRNQALSANQNGAALPPALSAAARKKEKKKEKAATLTIEEFNAKKQQQRRNSDDSDEQQEHLPKPIVPRTTIPAGEGDPAYLERLDKDATDSIVREQKQKDFKKQYEVENAQTSKFKSELASKDKEISLLTDSTKKLEDELQSVKLRNKQLCHILGQGEMKDKNELLLELDELRQVRDDLTQEVSRLTSDLEKERSKCHGLKGDIDKAKAGKHGGK